MALPFFAVRATLDKIEPAQQGLSKTAIGRGQRKRGRQKQSKKGGMMLNPYGHTYS